MSVSVDGPGAGELAREQEHLELASRCLVLMRAGADALADYGVDALASESLGRLRSQRLKALDADPDAPPFFGRTDRDDGRVDVSAALPGVSGAREGRGDAARGGTERRCTSGVVMSAMRN